MDPFWGLEQLNSRGHFPENPRHPGSVVAFRLKKTLSSESVSSMGSNHLGRESYNRGGQWVSCIYILLHMFTCVFICPHTSTRACICSHILTEAYNIHADKGFLVLTYVSYVHICSLHMFTFAQHCSHMFTYLYLGSHVVCVSIHL